MTQLQLDAGRLEEIAGQFQTPFYLYSADTFRRRHQGLASCLAPRAELFYAVKANPLREVLALMRGCGGGAEVGSLGELQRALAAGFDPLDIVYTCPGKTAEGVALALEAGILSINLESLDEATLVNAVAGRAGRVAPVVVRVNPLPYEGQGLRMSGIPSQFGVDEECLGEFCEQLRTRMQSLALVGVHLYSGTQILDTQQLISDAERALRIGRHLAAEHGVHLRLIDIGGGYGVPYRPLDPSIDLERLAAGYSEVLARYGVSGAGVRVIAESGRYVAADAGIFVTRVLSTKVSRGHKFVICDGGYAHHSAALHIARTGENRYPVSTLSSGAERECVTVVGPSGTPIDVLARQVWLEPLGVGDLLIVGKSGAYGYTNSCQQFFSGPSPAELMLDRDELIVLRRRGELREVGQCT